MSPVEWRCELRREGFTLRLDETVADGEVLVVLGPNGAGKSTALRMLAGIEQQATTLGGHDNVGLVPQDHRLFPHLTVRQNVEFGPRAQGRRSDAARVASRWMATLGVEALQDLRAADLSGGQTQRVALARALAAEPEVLLLDEPTASLDAIAKGEIRTVLREVLAAFEGPVVLVTHDPLDALLLADRILVLERGMVTQSGTAHELARRPQTDYIAAVMGLNLLRGVSEGDMRVRLQRGGELRVADRAPAGEVLIALRPSEITVHRARPRSSSPRNSWPAEVTTVEVLGSRVRMQTHGEPEVFVEITAEALAELGLGVGSNVWLSAKATALTTYPALYEP